MSTRRALVARKICAWARATKSCTASLTGSVLIAAETASVTTGRAAETKFEVRREPERRLVGDEVAHVLALGRLGHDVAEAVGVEHARRQPPTGRAERHENHAEERDQPHPPTAEAVLALHRPGSLGSRSFAGRSVAQGDLDLDLDRTAPGQGGDADGGATVASVTTEHVGEETARAVDDRGLLGEALHARDEPDHGEHARDAVEGPQFGAQHREGVQRAPARRFCALLRRDIQTERSLVDESCRRGRAAVAPTCARGRRAPRPRPADRAAGRGPGG